MSNGSTQYQKLENRLLLLSWLNSLLGYEKNSELLEDMKQAEEGFDAQGRSHIYYRLISRGSKLKISADDLNARGYRKAANTIERFLPGLMSYTAFPKQHGKRIRTTNLMERVNKELKRRTKVVGAFPNEESLLRLVGSILMDINEEWVTGRRYLTMEKE